MRYRWISFLRRFRTNRPSIMPVWVMIFFVLAGLWNRDKILTWTGHIFEIGCVEFAERQFENWRINQADPENFLHAYVPELYAVLENPEETQSYEQWVMADPSYERMMAGEWERIQYQYEESEYVSAETDRVVQENALQMDTLQTVVLEKLADFDFLLQNFYSIHPTTTAGKDLLDAGRFLDLDLSLASDGANPQILIYHTHSQEEYADYPENSEATIVGVGVHLAKLLEARGYRVLHDTSQYDVREGELDRNHAYTYALDGISGILQKYPSIEVVLDLHRDGVADGTRLVTEINGKETAQIMFFNGISQTPDGPIEYLPNPNREGNLAFSFQMQMKAAEQYPGLTRKIYLKGLRYNQHVRARAALIEVGAQTNTYAEALNAMEPLADILCRVLEGD